MTIDFCEGARLLELHQQASERGVIVFLASPQTTDEIAMVLVLPALGRQPSMDEDQERLAAVTMALQRSLSDAAPSGSARRRAIIDRLRNTRPAAAFIPEARVDELVSSEAAEIATVFERARSRDQG